MANVNEPLGNEETGAVTMLLQAGKTIKEIAKFADLDVEAVTKVARRLDIEPGTESQRRAKSLYGSPEGLTFQEIAKTLSSEGFSTDDDGPMHHLTIASWVKNHGWPWGGADDGEYAPDRAAVSSSRSRYLLRMSKSIDAEINTQAKIDVAAEAAWAELVSDSTRIVQLAIIRGAAEAGVTDLAATKKALLAAHGDELRNSQS